MGGGLGGRKHKEKLGGSHHRRDATSPRSPNTPTSPGSDLGSPDRSGEPLLQVKRPRGAHGHARLWKVRKRKRKQ